MVDVSDKLTTLRSALAEGSIYMAPETVRAIQENQVAKGNVLTTAKIAGIQAAKKTAELIPMCHPVNLSHADITFRFYDDYIGIQAAAKGRDTTGIEMEVLTAVSVAALTIYDMCKAMDKTMTIQGIRLLEKSGGKSHHISHYRPVTGIIVLSDRISQGISEDRSGKILMEGFSQAGCTVEKFTIIPDEGEKLRTIVSDWAHEGVELILTSGGTGLGPRDITIDTLAPLMEKRLPGVEEALLRYGSGKLKEAMLSRLMAGTLGNSIVVSIPGSTGAARDALAVLIPTIFHAFDMMQGGSH